MEKMVNEVNTHRLKAECYGEINKKMFGRQMIFFKCADKNERMNCALGQMKMWLESHYSDDRDMTEYGLPEDQYEAAGLALMVKYSAATEEEKFLSNFFWGGKW